MLKPRSKFTSLFPSVFAAIGLAMLAVCMTILYFDWKGALKIACITVLIIGISSLQGINGGIWSAAIMRFIESALGGFTAIAATIGLEKLKNIPLRNWSLTLYRTYSRFFLNIRRWALDGRRSFR